MKYKRLKQLGKKGIFKFSILFFLVFATYFDYHPCASAGGCRASPWIFIHGSDKVEEGLMVLFFGLVFSVAPTLPALT